ncbi:MAG: hypothetical protein ACRCY8_15820 [Dermatophilaceae bacterium]
MFRTSKTDRAKDAVAAGSDRVAEGASATVETVKQAAVGVGERTADVKDRATEAAAATADQYAAVRERVSDVAGSAREKAEEAADHVGPKVDQVKDSFGEAKELFVEEVLPKLLAAAATVAAGAVAAKDQAVETADRAPEALAVLTGDAEVKKGGKGKWVLLIGLAAGAAVFAWRKSQERPDPWATAAPYTPSATSSSTATGGLGAAAREKAAGVKAAAATAAASATEKAAELKDTAVEKAAELKDTAAEKATELGDTAGEKTADATDATSTKAADLKDAAGKRAADAKRTAGSATNAAAEKAGRARHAATPSAATTVGTADPADAGTSADGVTDESAATWTDAGEFSADDAPSASGTSEGTDLSTSNLDTGTRRSPGTSSGTS